MPDWMFWLVWLMFVVPGVIGIVKQRGFKLCGCPKRKRGFLGPTHQRRWVLAYDAIYWPTFAVLHLLYGEKFALVATALAVYSGFRLYYHEKDKIKRAARALGRVSIGEHGRLVVE